MLACGDWLRKRTRACIWAYGSRQQSRGKHSPAYPQSSGPAARTPPPSYPPPGSRAAGLISCFGCITKSSGFHPNMLAPMRGSYGSVHNASSSPITIIIVPLLQSVRGRSLRACSLCVGQLWLDAVHPPSAMCALCTYQELCVLTKSTVYLPSAMCALCTHQELCVHGSICQLDAWSPLQGGVSVPVYMTDKGIASTHECYG